ncbi:hypothetical protein [Microbacterium sp. NIBRBAC000506063]|uniref:hypothetical protein n=1 Tax=Microbacterium sp. NIBRBAC000506063 TaxID=2734618 RepID=UPI0039812D07
MYAIAVLGTVAIVGANTLLRPVSRLVNRRGSASPDVRMTDDSVEYYLEARTNDKSEPRIRALVLQAVNRPEFTLRSIKSSAGKHSLVNVNAALTASSNVDPSSLERAVHRISLDPKVQAVRWWAADPEE